MSARTTTQKANASAVDQDIASFVRKTAAASHELTSGQPVSLERRRQVAELVRKPWRTGGPEMAESTDFTIGDRSLRARMHVPRSLSGRGTMLYLHGGGWVMFSIDTHDRLMREYAHRTGLTVVGLDYSLSPEHRFPQALDDVDALYDWLGTARAIDDRVTGRLIVAGDSAGANLALSSTIRRRDRNALVPDGILLNYAAVDTETRPTHERYSGAPYMLDRDEMADFWRSYLGSASTDNPYARPLLADLSGLPPIHLCIAECDVLLDENLELSRRLLDAGCDVSTMVYEGATHSFLEAMSISALADKAIEDAASWVKSVTTRQ